MIYGKWTVEKMFLSESVLQNWKGWQLTDMHTHCLKMQSIDEVLRKYICVWLYIFWILEEIPVEQSKSFLGMTISLC